MEILRRRGRPPNQPRVDIYPEQPSHDKRVSGDGIITITADTLGKTTSFVFRVRGMSGNLPRESLTHSGLRSLFADMLRSKIGGDVETVT